MIREESKVDKQDNLSDHVDGEGSEPIDDLSPINSLSFKNEEGDDGHSLLLDRKSMLI